LALGTNLNVSPCEDSCNEKLGLTQPTISHHLSKNETIKRGKLKGKKIEYAARI